MTELDLICEVCQETKKNHTESMIKACRVQCKTPNLFRKANGLGF